MICPHCGRHTQAAEKCEHCKQPTEFARRVNYRPEKIPGMKEESIKTSPPSRSSQNASAKWIIASTAAILLFIVTNTVWGINYSQLLRIHQNIIQEFYDQDVTVTEATSAAEEVSPETPAEPVVILHTNYQWDATSQSSMETIQFGQEIPMLSNTDSHLFCGWNTDPAGLGTSFSSGDLFLIPLSEDLALYAQWEPIPTELYPSDTPISETSPAATDAVFMPNSESEEIPGKNDIYSETPGPDTDSFETHPLTDSTTKAVCNNALNNLPSEDAA